MASKQETERRYRQGWSKFLFDDQRGRTAEGQFDKPFEDSTELFNAVYLRLQVLLQIESHLIVRLLVTLGATASMASAQVRVSLSYLGTAGWEITDGKTVILIDPYISRLKTVTPNDSVLDEDPRPSFSSSDFAKIDTAAIDQRIRRADYVLITHTHFDHALDMPYIATKTGATVIGTESTASFARANGVPNQQFDYRKRR